MKAGLETSLVYPQHHLIQLRLSGAEMPGGLIQYDFYPAEAKLAFIHLDFEILFPIRRKAFCAKHHRHSWF